MMVLPAKPTKRIRLKRGMLVLLPLTAAILLLQYTNNNNSNNTSNNLTSAPHHTTPPRARYDPTTKQQLRLWRDDGIGADATIVPTGMYDYQQGMCQATNLECTVYFSHADLSDLIHPDELLDGTRNGKSRTFNTRGVLHPKYDPPKLLTNYTEYTDHKALLTRRGNKGHDVPNQDRIVMLRQGEERLIMALFDGHGPAGHDVAHAAALGMLQRLSLPKTKPWESTLPTTFLQLDRALPKTTATHSGCTAIVIIQEGSQILVANLGDSQAFIAEYSVRTKETSILYKTTPHKPHLLQERDRIEAAGGHVMLPERPGESSRVVIPMGRMEMALAMSRSLGDSVGKDLGVLTAQPTVDRVVLNQKDEDKLYFAVAATDGIFDCMDLDDVARHVGKAMYSPSSKLRPVDACEQLIVRSSFIWKYRFDALYRDDISIMVSKL